jgi:hypothetical protein
MEVIRLNISEKEGNEGTILSEEEYISVYILGWGGGGVCVGRGSEQYIR